MLKLIKCYFPEWFAI